MNGNPPRQRPVLGGTPAASGQGQFSAGTPGPGMASSAQLQAQRQRQMGGDAANRAAYQNDYTQSNEARGRMSGALDMTQAAAMGNAPSRAEILGQQMVGNSLDAQLAGAASARGGPMAQAAAARQAAAGAATMQQRGAADIAALRADEMARARNELMQGSAAMRGQDLQAAGMQAENERFQRGLNQQGQLSWEGLAQDTDKTQALIDMQTYLDDSANERADKELSERHWATQAGMNQGSRQRGADRIFQFLGGAAQGVGGAIGGLLSSDPASKEGIQDLSAPMGSAEPWMPPRADVDFIRFGGNASDEMLDDRYAQQANPPAPWLEQAMAPPPPAPRGVAGAPQGYAASRRGQPGSMFDAPMESSADGAELAPGQADWDRYGAPAAAAGDVDWSKGGATPNGGAAQPGWLRALAGGLGGFGASMKTSDPLSKSMVAPMSGPAPASFAGGAGMLGGSPLGELQAHSNFATQFQRNAGAGPLAISDPRAKREAFVDGINFGQAQIDHAQGNGPAPTPPKYMPNTRVPGGGAHGVYALQVDKPSEYDTKVANRPWGGNDDDPRNAPMGDPSAAPPAQMMDALGSGKTFRYRPGVPGEDPNKQHFGTTTEDLKKTPMGASMVVPGAVGGYDAIDTKEAVGPTLSALGNLNQRLRRLEGAPQPEHVPRRERR